MSEARNWVELARSTPAGANEVNVLHSLMSIADVKFCASDELLFLQDPDSALQQELKTLIDSTTDQSMSSMNN